MSMNRRDFLNLSALFGVSALGGPVFGKKMRVGRSGKASILGTARNCIIINLLGAPSHVDSFDLKTGSWLPDTFSPTDLGNGILWPANIMPKLAMQKDRFSLIRSLYTNELNHQRAQFRLETAHPFVAAKILQNDIAPMGSILAAELDHQRNEDDIYPLFVSMDQRPKDPGVFENRFAGFYLSGNFGLDMFSHPTGDAVFDKRFNTLFQMDPRKRMVTEGDPNAVSYLWEQAGRLMGDPRVTEAFDLDQGTLERYGNWGLGPTLARAGRMLSQNAGARCINVGSAAWDHHSYLYHALSYRLEQLDKGLAALMDDLALAPGLQEGQSMLDETLIIVAGEFGRTPGPLNAEQGRHHHGGAFCALVAGGGVQGNRVIGTTDETGDQIIDIGWSGDRAVSTTDLSATLLSAMGVDYTKFREDTPSGRTYYYTAPEQWMNHNQPKPITELFT